MSDPDRTDTTRSVGSPRPFGKGSPLLQTTIVNKGLYLAFEALGLKKAGLHAFRRGCNRRSELAGIVRAVIRQEMGHSSATMTRL
jgi:integrase